MDDVSLEKKKKTLNISTKCKTANYIVCARCCLRMVTAHKHYCEVHLHWSAKEMIRLTLKSSSFSLLQNRNMPFITDRCLFNKNATTSD